MEPGRDIDRLIAIMAALRHPETGCPWDIEQSFGTIAPYTIEEAYEVANAIARNDMVDLCDELGDLLLQVVYHARLAEEAGLFAFPDVVEAVTTKMIRRHPHVFGDDAARSAGAAKGFWEAAKSQEKQARRAGSGETESAPGLLDDVPAYLPGLARAMKLQKVAATVGFDWDDRRQVVKKIREELDEVERELDKDDPPREKLEDEIGDLLFTVVNLARHVGADPDHGLQRTNAKVVRRFGAIEAALRRSGRTLEDASLEEMERLWQAAKRDETDAQPRSADG